MWRRMRIEWFLLCRRLSRSWRKAHEPPLGENYPVYASLSWKQA